MCSKGWQTHIVANDEDPALFKADPSVVPLQTYLGTVERLVGQLILACKSWTTKIR